MTCLIRCLRGNDSSAGRRSAGVQQPPLVRSRLFHGYMAMNHTNQKRTRANVTVIMKKCNARKLPMEVPDISYNLLKDSQPYPYLHHYTLLYFVAEPISNDPMPFFYRSLHTVTHSRGYSRKSRLHYRQTRCK